MITSPSPPELAAPFVELTPENTQALTLLEPEKPEVTKADLVVASAQPEVIANATEVKLQSQGHQEQQQQQQNSTSPFRAFLKKADAFIDKNIESFKRLIT